MFKIILGLSNILNIIKENSGIHRGSSCGRRMGGQRFATAATVTLASAANSGNGGGRPTVGAAEAARGQTTINQKAAAITGDTVVAVETATAVAVAVAVAMAAIAAAMATTTRQPWQQ